MQTLAQSIWSFDEHHHVGGLAWQRFEHMRREPEWPTRIWEADGRIVAWAWLYEHDPDTLYLQAHPDHPALLDAALDWFETVASVDELEIAVFEHEHRLRAALVARGYLAQPDAPFGLRRN